MGPGRRAVVLAALLAGCAAPSGPSDAIERVLLYAYDCPEPSAPCSDLVSVAGEASMEPVVAPHSVDPDVFAIVHAVGTTPPSLTTTGAATCRLVALFSTDAGASWRSSAPAIPQASGSRCTYSPDARFDGAGRLHVVAFDTLQPGSVARTLYVRSDDLGASWSEPVVLFDGNHPGISISPEGIVVVTSRSGTDGRNHAKLAWSADHGASWKRAAPEETIDCNLPTRAAFRDGRAVFACARVEGSEWSILVYSFGLTDERVALLGTLGPLASRGYLRPFLTDLPDGRLALHYFDVAFDEVRLATADYEDRTHLAWSSDGGRSWGPPTQVVDRVEGDWSEYSAGAAADPAGGYHLLITLALSPTPGTIDEELRHVVLDATGSKVHDSLLAKWSHAKAESPSAGLRAQGWIREPFAAMAWSDARGIVAYPSLDASHGLRIARVDLLR